MVMETIYGADRVNTFENIYNSNNLYDGTLTWSDYNIFRKYSEVSCKTFPFAYMGDWTRIR